MSAYYYLILKIRGAVENLRLKQQRMVTLLLCSSLALLMRMLQCLWNNANNGPTRHLPLLRERSRMCKSGSLEVHRVLPRLPTIRKLETRLLLPPPSIDVMVVVVMLVLVVAVTAKRETCMHGIYRLIFLMPLPFPPIM
jgi:hypothetical protein